MYLYPRCSNAKRGPRADYNAYKEFVIKDTTALFLAAAMEVFGLDDPKGYLTPHFYNVWTTKVTTPFT